jgi:hypothetical protein
MSGISRSGGRSWGRSGGRFGPRAALLLLALLASGQAAAESRIVDAHQLVITDTLESLVITTDPTLSGRMRLSLDSDLSCLSIVSSGPGVVVGTSGCDSDTGPLRIEIAPDTDVTLSASGDGSVHIGDLGGPFVATLTDSIDLHAGRVGHLNLIQRSRGDAILGDVGGEAILQMSGSGDVKLREVRGTLNVRQHGSGDLVVGGIDADSVDLSGTGSGDMLIGSGRIARLAARMVGSGDLAVAATVQDGDVSAVGGGDIKLGRVTGHLTRNASGGSDIYVGGSAIITTVIGKIARALGDSDSYSASTATHHTSMSVHFGHLITGAFALAVLFIVWRIVQRGGGLGAFTRRMSARAPESPTHPGVIAVGETMTRLEQRLGRVESYVTTREFDLQRKFRELGPQ